MPSLSTNITDDDNISTSAILKLDSDQFTYFSDGDTLSNSVPSTLGITSSQLPYKRQRLTATFTWQFARNPLPYKATCDGKN